jgi:AbrB family looped-hinge helix DNA binding protein
MPNGIPYGMSDATLTIDGAGRLVLPKRLRERFRLRPGSRLEVEIHEDHLRLHPVGVATALTKEGGWWVHRGTVDPGSDLEHAVRDHREERLQALQR